MKRSLRCHSNRGEELSCGTTARGPCQAADHFRALICLFVVWKHECDITLHLTLWYPSITNLFFHPNIFPLLTFFIPVSSDASLFSCCLQSFVFPSSAIPSSFTLSLFLLRPVCANGKMAHPVICHIRYQVLLIKASFISTLPHQATMQICCIHTHTYTRTHMHRYIHAINLGSSSFTILSFEYDQIMEECLNKKKKM